MADYIVRVNEYYVCDYDKIYKDKIVLHRLIALPMDMAEANEIARLANGKVFPCKNDNG